MHPFQILVETFFAFLLGKEQSYRGKIKSIETYSPEHSSSWPQASHPHTQSQPPRPRRTSARGVSGAPRLPQRLFGDVFSLVLLAVCLGCWWHCYHLMVWVYL